jgi:hypothetical protein
MSFLGPTSDPLRQQVIDIRNSLLRLHKMLLDSERSLYEKVHGTIASPAAFLQLLIGDPWFAWLKPMTALVVEIDETLAARDLADNDDFRQLISRAGILLNPAEPNHGFAEHYADVIQRDSGVADLHAEITRQIHKPA